MASISWHYPHDELLALQRRNVTAEEAADRVIDRGLDFDNLRFRYAISGDNPPWRPVRVFDDTHKVYIQFPARRRPAAGRTHHTNRWPSRRVEAVADRRH